MENDERKVNKTAHYGQKEYRYSCPYCDSSWISFEKDETECKYCHNKQLKNEVYRVATNWDRQEGIR